MDTGKHDLSELFKQLGLPHDATFIRQFITSHKLGPKQELPEGDFWTAAQADFLRQALAADAEWSEAADELAILLSDD